ncbi:hypothetical protein EGT74_12690 [Chitinophaga lutea]|uniref:Secreted protein n=1 Tax=Chitinophaga lutea TaxID=2488634 RepID=A0A3N4PMR9_9BACT|nr:hypothetical protein [Chitinophaga lutea]RPE07929.1 hypothetical protein EGT74_12690 [Chitinophaga lutea]
MMKRKFALLPLLFVLLSIRAQASFSLPEILCRQYIFLLADLLPDTPNPPGSVQFNFANRVTPKNVFPRAGLHVGMKF